MCSSPQIPKMECFAAVVNGFTSFTIFSKLSGKMFAVVLETPQNVVKDSKEQTQLSASRFNY